jgi:hypothetical protein
VKPQLSAGPQLTAILAAWEQGEIPWETFTISTPLPASEAAQEYLLKCEVVVHAEAQSAGTTYRERVQSWHKHWATEYFTALISQKQTTIAASLQESAAMETQVQKIVHSYMQEFTAATPASQQQQDGQGVDRSDQREGERAIESPSATSGEKGSEGDLLAQEEEIVSDLAWLQYLGDRAMMDSTLILLEGEWRPAGKSSSLRELHLELRGIEHRNALERSLGFSLISPSTGEFLKVEPSAYTPPKCMELAMLTSPIVYAELLLNDREMVNATKKILGQALATWREMNLGPQMASGQWDGKWEPQLYSMDSGEVITLATLEADEAKVLEVWGSLKGMSISTMGRPAIIEVLGRQPKVALAVADRLTQVLLTANAVKRYGPAGCDFRLLPHPAKGIADPPTAMTLVAAHAMTLAVIKGQMEWAPFLTLADSLPTAIKLMITRKVPALQVAPIPDMGQQGSQEASWEGEDRPLTQGDMELLGLSPIQAPRGGAKASQGLRQGSQLPRPAGRQGPRGAQQQPRGPQTTDKPGPSSRASMGTWEHQKQQGPKPTGLGGLLDHSLPPPAPQGGQHLPHRRPPPKEHLAPNQRQAIGAVLPALAGAKRKGGEGVVAHLSENPFFTLETLDPPTRGKDVMQQILGEDLDQEMDQVTSPDLNGPGTLLAGRTLQPWHQIFPPKPPPPPKGRCHRHTGQVRPAQVPLPDMSSPFLTPTWIKGNQNARPAVEDTQYHDALTSVTEEED